MPNNCGYVVPTTCTSTEQLGGLCTAVPTTPILPEYKSSTFPLVQTQVIQQLIHCFFRNLTTVNWSLVPTIHTTNKNNDKFFIHKFNTYYRKAV